jgi:hypothetical protein
MAGPLNPPILGDFEAVLARKSPRIGGLGGGSAGSVASIFRFGIRPIHLSSDKIGFTALEDMLEPAEDHA